MEDFIFLCNVVVWQSFKYSSIGLRKRLPIEFSFFQYTEWFVFIRLLYLEKYEKVKISKRNLSEIVTGSLR